MANWRRHHDALPIVCRPCLDDVFEPDYLEALHRSDKFSIDTFAMKGGAPRR